MKRCIIFGCGNIGKDNLYLKITDTFNIIAYSDNNKELWGKTVHGITIIPPKDIVHIQRMKDTCIIVAIDDIRKSIDIIEQLQREGIRDISVWKGGYLYEYNRRDGLKPYVGYYSPYILSTDTMNILYVQNEACIRTHKIAKGMSDCGYNVYLAYTYNTPIERFKEYASVYKRIIPIHSSNDLISLTNSCNFDLIHSSNEPDYLSAALNKSSVAVVHDCHDLSSLYKSMTPEELVMEYIANKYLDGVIYSSNEVREIALKMFKNAYERTFVLENLISKELKPSCRFEKLSSKDGKLHAVYEGGVVKNKDSHRFFEEIWQKIAKCNVNIHFYTNCDFEYCKYLESLSPYIHYEGNMTSKDLANEMSRYDVGLSILNVTFENKKYLESSFPNKIQEYINAGLPVAVGNNIQSQIDFVKRYRVGDLIDFNDDIHSQLSRISKICIDDDNLEKNGLVLEVKVKKLADFYKNCINYKRNKTR
ncbi:hypothetical protein [Butyrivibrio sp. NC3005]|uniref:hypothetical protein n=1 Tax=Butyrivibrio sp. NC3005 TaxID=1280685 RepID=UPI00041940E8|nr:hypothetical protein [Butyrivibrio sp. NC3005]